MLDRRVRLVILAFQGVYKLHAVNFRTSGVHIRLRKLSLVSVFMEIHLTSAGKEGSLLSAAVF